MYPAPNNTNTCMYVYTFEFLLGGIKLKNEMRHWGLLNLLWLHQKEEKGRGRRRRRREEEEEEEREGGRERRRGTRWRRGGKARGGRQCKKLFKYTACSTREIRIMYIYM